MRFFIICSFFTFLIASNVSAQSSTTFRDTANNFEISIPEGWEYVIPEEGSLAINCTNFNEDGLGESFNINIIGYSGNSLDQLLEEYKMIVSKKTASEILIEGDKLINFRPYKYLANSYSPESDNEKHVHYAFMTIEDGHAFILTFGVTLNRFEKYKKVFEQIASTLFY